VEGRARERAPWWLEAMIENKPATLDRLRRAEGLERTMLALRDARDSLDVLAIVARGIGRDLRRTCSAFEFRGGHFRNAIAPNPAGKLPPALQSADTEALRHHVLVPYAGDMVLGVASDGQLRAAFVLEGNGDPLEDEETKYLRALAAHVSLALSNALAFEQLRRYAAEGAALTEAARTILGYTALEPLADSLCRLALRLVFAERACIFAMGPDGLERVAFAAAREEFAPPEDVDLAGGDGSSALAMAFGGAALIVTRLRLPGAEPGPEHNGFLVVSRTAPFERSDSRVIETLKSLAALAMRNVDLYEQTSRANQALAESNAFKDDLMAMFAHDFKGPLTVISGFSELMIDAEDAAVRHGAETIVEQTRRLAKLSDDALALAATQSAGFSLSRSQHDLTEFVRGVVAPLDREERVQFDAPEEPALVSFDRMRLRHAIENVVGNALKYASGPINIALRAGPDEVRVEVADRGIGVPPGELDKIFSRFGRGTNARSRGIGGSGVGLYIAKKIVEVHGGRLEVASVENEGSTFSIVLPRQAELPSRANG
jgi:signal transduction histidine kinase